MHEAPTTTSKVRDVMTKQVVTIGPSDAVHDALDFMSENRVSALPVVDKKRRCIGILSMSDLIDLTRAVDMTFDEQDGDSSNHIWACSILRDHYGAELVESIMTRDVEVVSPESTIKDAARHMLRDRIHHVPVVDGHGYVQGMLSTFDLMRILAD